MVRAPMMGLGVCLLSGCASFTRAEMGLTSEARKGIALVRKNDAARDGLIDELNRLRRERIDEAFDADVREHATTQPLDSDWVIEARKAYAVGLDSYARAQAAEIAASEKRKQVLSDIDLLLGRLEWMQSVRMRFDAIGDLVTGMNSGTDAR